MTRNVLNMAEADWSRSLTVINNSLCECETGIESEHHFLMVCFNYTGTGQASYA